MAFASVGFCYEAVKVTNKLTYAFFKGMFIDPTETMYIIMSDMSSYVIHSYDDRGMDAVSFSVYGFEERLKKDGYVMADVAVIIHNHYTKRYFSLEDIRLWQRFKKRGFLGNFYLYVNMNKTIYELMENIA